MSLFSSFGNYLFGVPQANSAPYTADADAARRAAAQYAGREQSDYDSEARLGSSLWNTVNGTAPSVAGLQLQQTLGQEQAANLAAGAGSTGTNSVLARYQALINNGNQQAQTAQSGALLRAKEVSDAQGRLSGLYNNMEGSSAGLYGTNLSTGLGYSNLANSVDQANAQRAQQSEAAGLQALSGAGSMVFGRTPTPIASATPSYGSLYSRQQPGYAASQYAGS